MKKIIFVRHGRAEDQTPDLPDFERSLTLKGKNISRLMAGKLKEKEINLGLLITSPAFRSIETALIFAGAYGIEAEKIMINSSLYFKTDINSFVDILKPVSEDIDTITLFGHNPSFTELANSYCKEGCDVVPKSGIVCLSFGIRTWSEIKPNTGQLDLFLKPKKVL
jgi:phosphohistidine phosphatase